MSDLLVSFKELAGMSPTTSEFNGLSAKSLQRTRNVQFTKVRIAAPWSPLGNFPYVGFGPQTCLPTAAVVSEN